MAERSLSVMKKYHLPLFTLVAFLLAGCATTFHPLSLSKIHAGMSMAEVQAILGEPDRVTTDRGMEYLHYLYSEGYNPPLSPDRRMDFEALRQIREDEFERSLKQYHYVVEIKNGRVMHYGHWSD